MARPIYPPRGQGPAGNLPDGSVGTVEIADAAITQPKLGTDAVGVTAVADGAIKQYHLGNDSVGLSAIADPMRRRTQLVALGSLVIAGDNFPLMHAGAEAPRIMGCYVNSGVEMRHDEASDDMWTFQLKNITRALSMAPMGTSLSGITLAATAWRAVPLSNGNSTLGAGDCLQMHLTVSGTGQTLDRFMCQLEWQPTVNT